MSPREKDAWTKDLTEAVAKDAASTTVRRVAAATASLCLLSLSVSLCTWAWVGAHAAAFVAMAALAGLGVHSLARSVMGSKREAEVSITARNRMASLKPPEDGPPA